MGNVGNTLRLKSVHGSAVLELVGGPAPSGLTSYDGWTYTARLVGPPVDAQVEVYDIEPACWTRFLTALANDWNGWSGIRSHESLEGHLRLDCSADSLGHVEVRVTLRGLLAEDDWRAEVALHLEAGGLERLAGHAAQFFGRQRQ